MKSAIAITHEIDDLDFAANELVSQINEKLEFQKNSIGLAFCDADVDVAELGRLLHEQLRIDIVGLTTTATLARHHGYNDMGISLSILTADDVTFTTGSTGELRCDDFREIIKEDYLKTRARVEDDPRLIMCFTPYDPLITSENYIEAIDEVSGGVPIFGGVSTDHYDLQYEKTFLNGVEFTSGLVFLLFNGNIKPVFAMEHHFSAEVKRRGVITESSDNLVHRVGDQTFVDFVESMVPIPDETEIIYYFQSTPFIMELPDFDKEEQPVVRALCTLDHKTGTGGFLSKMPEGSVIYLNMLEKDNLSQSCNGAISSLLNQMNQDSDYEYSMIFVVSCNARHLLMGNAKDLESNILEERLSGLPAELNAMGFYGFGEYSPTGKRADGTAKNRFHNISFAVCAI